MSATLIEVDGIPQAFHGALRGESIYQMAQRVQGFTGTEEEYLASLANGGLPTGTLGQFISYDATGTPVAVDAAIKTDEEMQDFLAAMFTGGSHTNLTVTYNDVAGVLSFALTGEAFTTLEKTKLAGIAEAATANAPDASLRDRTTHTGTQEISTITNLQTSLDGKAATAHTHVIADVTNLQTALDGKAATAHTHTISGVTGLQTALDDKAAASHTHVISDVTGLQIALDDKATVADIIWVQDMIEARQNNWIGTQAEYDALPQVQKDDPTITHLVTD